MSRILFVCMGNICRSPTAEGIVNNIIINKGMSGLIKVDSAGTHGYHIGEPPDPRTCEAALRRGIDLSGLRARKVRTDTRKPEIMRIRTTPNKTVNDLKTILSKLPSLMGKGKLPFKL